MDRTGEPQRCKSNLPFLSGTVWYTEQEFNPQESHLMKAFILSLPVIGMAAGAYAQGFIFLDNINNTDTSIMATSSGLFFLNPSGNPPLSTGDLNAAFYGGTDSANLQLIASFWGASAVGSDAFGPGTFLDPTGRSYPVPGTTATSTSAFFMVQAWTGTATSYAAAYLKGQSPVFSNPVAAPPYPPPDLVRMPAVTILIPEPSTFALIAFEAVGLFAFRLRR
jgi:hypothetical protein